MALGLIASSLLIGAAHAFEADHLAAMGSLAAERKGWRGLTARGALWGLGHTLTLFVLSMAVVLLGWTLTPKTEALLEFGVGAMLVLLGGHVLIHTGGIRADRHRHSPRRTLKPVAIGMVHGAAGSGALIAVIAAASLSPRDAALTVLAFGSGSIAGMALVSALASWPLTLLATRARHALLALRAAAGAFALALGGSIMVGNFGAV